MMKAVVIVETKFLISLLFPHLDLDKHQQAHRLLAENGAKEFSKVPIEIYEKYHLIHYSSFDFKNALVAWNAKYLT